MLKNQSIKIKRYIRYAPEFDPNTGADLSATPEGAELEGSRRVTANVAAYTQNDGIAVVDGAPRYVELRANWSGQRAWWETTEVVFGENVFFPDPAESVDPAVKLAIKELV